MAHLVDTDWLSDNINDHKVRPIDGNWSFPDRHNDLPQGYISGAVFFDLDHIAAPHPSLSHMLPPQDIFVQAVSEMGLSADDHIICYDRHGLFSAPRLWWTFRRFGHENISILNGGLPAWIKDGGALSAQPTPYPHTEYKAKPPLNRFVDFDDILNRGPDVQIIDARPKGRFLGIDPEPRKGLCGGHIPESLSLPFDALKTADGYFKNIESLQKIIRQANINLNAPIITSCGSGITAAGLAFALELCGAKDVQVYDGSWAEYGASGAPVASGTM